MSNSRDNFWEDYWEDDIWLLDYLKDELFMDSVCVIAIPYLSAYDPLLWEMKRLINEVFHLRKRGVRISDVQVMNTFTQSVMVVHEQELNNEKLVTNNITYVYECVRAKIKKVVETVEMTYVMIHDFTHEPVRTLIYRMISQCLINWSKTTGLY